MVNEPTMKEIAEALNKAANLFRAFAFTNINKQQKNLLLDDLRNFIVLAAQVEAMGERLKAIEELNAYFPQRKEG